jgi:hypothetical protein
MTEMGIVGGLTPLHVVVMRLGDDKFLVVFHVTWEDGIGNLGTAGAAQGCWKHSCKLALTQTRSPGLGMIRSCQVFSGIVRYKSRSI